MDQAEATITLTTNKTIAQMILQSLTLMELTALGMTLTLNTAAIGMIQILLLVKLAALVEGDKLNAKMTLLTPTQMVMIAIGTLHTLKLVGTTIQLNSFQVRLAVLVQILMEATIMVASKIAKMIYLS